MNRSGGVSAAKREATARDYRRLAELLREQEGGDGAAGAILYEAAKQCINAVANQHGVNPGPTGAKVRFLDSLAEVEMEIPYLLRNWHSASDLHINADRLTMRQDDLETAWSNGQTFIAQMLQIYAHGQQPDTG